MANEVIIETKSGRVRGLLKSSLLGDQYYSFQKIPYAKAPIGDLRFKAPVPVDQWNDTLDATREGPVPYYVKTFFEGLPRSEDCLHLNIYSKNIKPSSKLPVIVFIYGGSFNSGSSTTKLYGPDYLMQKDVILVTFNYRVGVLGFLHFNDPSLEIAGNAALKDQLLVLKWVQENIENFGGDKNNVTLVGNSAGSGSVSYHLISDVSKNLFHRAILMSGTAFSAWNVMPPNPFGLDLAKATGWHGKGGEKGALDHLIFVDADVLMQQSKNILTKEHLLHGFFFPFAPMIETYASDSCFMSEHPVKLARNAWSKNVDILIGYTTNEGLFQASNENKMTYKIPLYQLVVPLEARTGKSESELKEDAKRIRELYNNFDDLTDTNLQPFFDFASDLTFIHGIHRNVLSRLNHKGMSHGKTYIYRFCYHFDNRNHHKMAFGAKNQSGVSHADDLSYIFTNTWGDIPDKDTEEWNAIQKMVNLFTGFATNGSDTMKKLEWDDVKKDELPYDYKCMHIDNEWKMTKLPEFHRIKVWDSIYPKNDLY